MSNNKWDVYKSVREGIGEIQGKLDYTLTSGEERVELLHNLIQNSDWFEDYLSSQGAINKQIKNKIHFLSENEPFSQGIEKLADYILMCEDELEKNDISKYPYMTQSNFSLAKKREVTMSQDELAYYKELEQKAKKKNFKLDNPLKVTDSDRRDIKYLTQTGEAIEKLSVKIKQESSAIPEGEYNKTISKMKNTKIDLYKDEVEIKKQMKGVIYFKKLSPDETVFNFDQDTGYIDERGKYIKISSSKLDFSNKNHIKGFLKHYDSIRGSLETDIDSDLKHYMWVFEEYLRKCDFNKQTWEVVRLKLDGLSNKEIYEKLKLTYIDQLKINYQTISYILNNTVPKKVSEEYKRSKRIWLYGRKRNNQYKICYKCKSDLPLTEVFFRSRSDNKGDGFYNYCRRCEE